MATKEVNGFQAEMVESSNVKLAVDHKKSIYDDLVKRIVALPIGKSLVLTPPKGRTAVVYRNLLNTGVRYRLKTTHPEISSTSVRFFLTDDGKVAISRVAGGSSKKKAKAKK